MEEDCSSLKFITDKLTGIRALGSSRHNCEENVINHLNEIGSNTKNWINSVRDRDYLKVLVNAALNLRVSYATE